MTVIIRLGKPRPASHRGSGSVPQSAPSAKPYEVIVGATRQLATWMQKVISLRVPGRSSRRLRLAETISLGEKRFVAIVEVDGTPLLLGGSSTGVVLLKELGQQSAAPNNTFDHVLDEARYSEESAWFPQ